MLRTTVWCEKGPPESQATLKRAGLTPQSLWLEGDPLGLSELVPPGEQSGQTPGYGKVWSKTALETSGTEHSRASSKRITW